MPPEEQPDPAKPENDAKPVEPKKDAGSQRRTSRTRGIVLMGLAFLALTAFLTLVAETIWQKPTKIGPHGNDITTTPAAPKPPSAVIVVTVGLDNILVDGLPVARTQPLIDGKKVENIPTLKVAMDQRRAADSVGGRVGLAVEKGMPPHVIRSVFLTLAFAGYRDVHLVGASLDAGDSILQDE